MCVCVCVYIYIYIYTAAAAKSLQSCPTLCDPIDGSPPGPAVPGILQARTLEWVAIAFSNAWKWKVKGKSLSRVWLLATPWTTAYQAPPSMGFFQARVLEWGAIAFSDIWYSCIELNTHTHRGFPGGASGKEPPYQCKRHKRHGFDPWVRKILSSRAWPPTPLFLPGKFHGHRSLVGYSP